MPAECLISWARMDFKPAKSRSLVVRKRNVTDKFHFSPGGVQIPSITEKPVKSLEKVLNSILRDTATLPKTGKELHAWIGQGWHGKFKAWIYQHGILPQLLWLLLVYDVPLTIGFERKISHSLRRWLGLPQSITSIALYGRKNKLQLPFSSLLEEYRCCCSENPLTPKFPQLASW